MKKNDEEKKKKSNTDDEITDESNKELTSLQDIENIPPICLAEDLVSSDKAQTSQSRQKGKSSDSNQVEELLQETVEDILHLMERVNLLEQHFNNLNLSITDINQKIEKSYRDHAVALEKIKTDLLSDRKAMVARFTFNAIIPAIESLEISRSSLDKSENEFSYNKLSGIIDLLVMILQGLGFESFSPEIGDSFDPVSMECVDYSDGEEKQVVRIAAPGYRSGTIIVKPSRVVLGKPENN